MNPHNAHITNMGVLSMNTGIGGWLFKQLSASRHSTAPALQHVNAMQHVDPHLEMMDPFTLGLDETENDKKRTRREIYTTWMMMSKDPSIGEAIGLHCTAALGGHEAKGEMVFMTPIKAIRGKGRRAGELRRRVEDQSRRLSPMFNAIAEKICTEAQIYGDSYVRMLTEEKVGVVALIANEYTHPVLIRAYEQGDVTVGYRCMDYKRWDRTLVTLNTMQMARMKMPRIHHIPQIEVATPLEQQILLSKNRRQDMPVVHSPVGGSFLSLVEQSWKDVNLTLAAMNSQQIADAVEQCFLTVNMAGMPAAQQKKYKAGLVATLKKHREFVRKALTGGEALWTKEFHVLPVFDDKQVLNPLGDLSRRSTPINIDTFMINVRRMMGGMGVDVSMVGWADMLAGGLGDGAAFHTSAQIQRRSVPIRRSLTEMFNHICMVDWGFRYSEYFQPQDYPWQFEYYSDLSAASSEAINNRMNRANSMALSAQSVAAIKELSLKDKKAIMIFLENIGGWDMDEAEIMADALLHSMQSDPEGMGGGPDGGGQPIDPQEGGEGAAVGDDDAQFE
jgi:hypothetical protein